MSLKVLEAGYNVLYSDSDISFFENPLPELKEMARRLGNVLLVQSNEPNATEPANGNRRINSGFYYALSNTMTIDAFRAISNHSMHTNLSEQPSFYDVLCGENRYREGSDACLLPNGLRTIFLDRDVYPNGKHRDLWEAPDVVANARRIGAKILHNNWIVGGPSKLKRQKVWWHFDKERMMCRYFWAAGAQVITPLAP